MLQDTIESLYHNCRSCRHFKNDLCLHDDTFEDTIDTAGMIQDLSNDGLISDAVLEGFTDCKFSKTKVALYKTNLSKKEINEIMNTIYQELEEKQKEWAEQIDKLIYNTIEKAPLDELEIIPKPKKPSDFFCKYFE